MVETGLEGKVAVVIGANHGVGAATARVLAAQKAAVFVTYLRLLVESAGVSEAEEASVPCQAFYHARQAITRRCAPRPRPRDGGRAEALEADLSDSSSVPRVFEAAEAALGPVDIFVNNAAHCVADTFVPLDALPAGARSPSGARLRTFSPEEHDRRFTVNSRAAARGAGRELGARSQRQHGRRVRLPGRGLLRREQAGARGLRQERGRGARAPWHNGDTVSLGAVQTGCISPEMEEEMSAEYPLRRVGRPEDVADVIVFFASEQARWVTAQTLYVGGGHAM